MGGVGYGYSSSEKDKPELKLQGNKVILKPVTVYCADIKGMYKKEITYVFENEEKAKEYYYKQM